MTPRVPGPRQNSSDHEEKDPPVRYVLLDFDGPICRLFDGYPTSKVSKKVQAALVAAGGSVAGFEGELDMHNMLRTMRGSRPWGELPEYLVRAEEELTRQEIKAVGSALPTLGVEQLLRELTDSGIELAIASNNSAPAISAFLHRRGLSKYVLSERIIGRSKEPGLMKPDPDSIERALSALGQPDRSTCLLLGDSLADAGAASKAGIRFAGFVRPDHPKAEAMEAELGNHGRNVVVRSLEELLPAFRWESLSEESPG